ncbi:MAG: di-trans,poly-cis-decaprenylcistransferase [Planctomycetota bacterium]|nr:MAG: di-trans,poly-cis-decaprenylcistransferase [Planctomycetota bacterium]
MPRHVAVIMDGNGRWARQRTLRRVMGHRRGVEAVRATVTSAAAVGIEYVTLYAFSTENWKRPQHEITVLMELLERFLHDELPTLLDNGIRLRAIGQVERLPASVRKSLQDTIAATAHGSGMELSLALSYGGRDELVAAMRSIAQSVANGSLAPEAISAADIQGGLYAPHLPDVDLVIRSAGEQRLSNFLPWQSIYAEFVTLEQLWPDIREEHIHQALHAFAKRQRRFGAVEDA